MKTEEDFALALEALRIRKGLRVCRECNAIIDDGLDHDKTCRFFAVEERAERMFPLD